MIEKNANSNHHQDDDEGTPDDRLLVAYLDGELDADQSSALEERLSSDSVLRQKLAGLQQSWDMLDDLPRVESNEAFVRSTIEMVVTSAYPRRRRWYRWPLRIGLCIAAFALMGIISLQTVRYRQNAPYREFVSDLKFIENIDRYNEINDFEFLEELLKEDLFGEELENDE